LERRGLPSDQWPRFRLGFAPSGRTGLKDHLIAKGADPKGLLEAGLLVAPEDGGTPYDRFRDRIMFPITDARGRVVSFGGRALDPEARAKYLNGPETPVFHKGALLYGLFEARRLLHLSERAGGEGRLAVVEGYMDVIACQRAEIPAVAPMGTALTEDQMAALWRVHPEPTLCFDGDEAGRRAAYRSLDRALPLLKPGRSFNFAAVTGAKDPDDVLREQGAAALRAQLSVTRPFVEVVFEQALSAAGELVTPERRTALKAELRKRAASIADPDLADAYKQDLLNRYRLLVAPAQETRPAPSFGEGSRHGRWSERRPGTDGISSAGATSYGRSAAKALARSIRPVAASLAQGLLVHPELIDEQLESLEVQGFGEQALERFAREIIRLRLTHPDLDSAALGRHLAESGLSGVLTEIARAANLAHAPFALPDMPTTKARAEWSRTYAVLLEVAALERAIKDAKLEGDFEALQSLKARRDSQKQKIASGSLWVEGAS
jgi:DNA primase